MRLNKKAEKVHQAILSYLRGKRSEDSVIEAIIGLDRDAMLELSSNGYSHLMDSLHLPYKISSARKIHPDDQSLFLFHQLSQQAKKLGPDVFATLLTQADKTGTTPLHYAANSNSITLFETFLSHMRATLSADAYHKALNYEDNRKQIPCCYREKSNATVINQRLRAERTMDDEAKVRISRKRASWEPVHSGISKASSSSSSTSLFASSIYSSSIWKKQRTVHSEVIDGRETLIVLFSREA